MIAELLKQVADLYKETFEHEKASKGIFRNLPIVYFKTRGKLANTHYQLAYEYEKAAQYDAAVSHYFKAWTLTQHNGASAKLRIPLHKQTIPQSKDETKFETDLSSSSKDAFIIGLRYLSGIGTEMNYNKALEAFTTAYAKTQSAQALLMIDLVQLHCFTDTTKLKAAQFAIIIKETTDTCPARDFLKYIISDKDMFWLISAADNNYPPAQYQFGLLLEDSEENEDAVSWIKKAAAQDYEPAMKKLAGQTVTPRNNLYHLEAQVLETGKTLTESPKPSFY